MRYLLICFLLLSAVGCRKPKPYTNEIYTDSMTRLVVGYAVELKYEMHLRLEHARVLYGEHPQLVLQFSSQDILDVKKARELLVDLVAGYLERINSENLVFEADLSHYYDVRDLDINIDFQSAYAQYADPFYIGSVILQDGMAYYYAADLKNDELTFWHSRIEPFFKSRSIVMAEREGEADYQAKYAKEQGASADALPTVTK